MLPKRQIPKRAKWKSLAQPSPLLRVADLFTNALEVFDYVQSAAAFDTTHEVLKVRIEVEKLRLLIWRQSIGLDGSADQRDNAMNEALDREYLRTAVAGPLVCFVKILFRF